MDGHKTISTHNRYSNFIGYRTQLRDLIQAEAASNFLFSIICSNITKNIDAWLVSVIDSFVAHLTWSIYPVFYFKIRAAAFVKLANSSQLFFFTYQNIEGRMTKWKYSFMLSAKIIYSIIRTIILRIIRLHSPHCRYLCLGSGRFDDIDEFRFEWCPSH